MGFVDQVLRRMGGVATTAELNERGVEDMFIQLEADRGKIIRIRRGWYACRDVPSPVIDAIRVGGRLGCVSALAYYGLRQPTDDMLHVAVPRQASRLRVDDRPVVLHWSRSEPTGNRYAVSIEQAQSQANRCSALI